MGRAAGLSSQGGVDPAGARGLLGGPPGGLAVLADRVAGQPGGVAGLRLQGGLLPPEDPGRQRRADPSRGDPAGLIRVVAWSPSSTIRATTSPPSGWGVSSIGYCWRIRLGHLEPRFLTSQNILILPKLRSIG